MDKQILRACPSVADIWQMGKTAASIKFVRDAETVVAASKDTITVGALTDAINKFKCGELVFNEFANPLDYVQYAG